MIDDQLRRMPDLLRRVTATSGSADFIVVYASAHDEGETFGYASTEMSSERLHFLLSRAAFVVMSGIEAHESDADEGDA